MGNFKNPTKVITGPNTTFSYLNCFEPKAIQGGTPKYSVSLIIPKSDTKTIEKIKAAQEKLDKTTSYDAYWKASDELTPLLIQYKLYTEAKVNPDTVAFSDFHSTLGDNNYIEVSYTKDDKEVVAYYDYKSYLEKKIKPIKGNFVDSKGNILGTHKGCR